MDKKVKPSIGEANILHLIIIILLLTIGSYLQWKDVYTGTLIMQYILILLPILLYLKAKGYSLKKVLRLNKISIRQIIMIVIITLFTYPIIVATQTILTNIIISYKDIVPEGLPLPENQKQYLISVFVIAITPGICEEVMYRGLMLDSYEILGRKKSIMITAILFAIFHFNLFNFLGPLILGIIFGIMVYKTNSIYSSIIGHTVNNTIALTLGYYLNKYNDVVDDISRNENPAKDIILIIIVIGFLIICLGIVINLLRRLSKESYPRQNRDLTVEEDIYRYRRIPSIWEFVPIFIIFLLFVIFNLAFFTLI